MALVLVIFQTLAITPLCYIIKMKFKNPNKNNALKLLKDLLVEKNIFTDAEFDAKVKEVKNGK